MARNIYVLISPIKQGGYEGSDASGVAPGSEKILMDAIKNLLHR